MDSILLERERPTCSGGWVVSFCAFVLLSCGASDPVIEAPAEEPEPPKARLVRRHDLPISAVETCFNAWDDNDNSLIDEGCGLRQGQLQFTLAWDDPEGDLDLSVRDPKGEIASPARVTQGGLRHSSDCPSSGEPCQGQNVENVYLEESVPLPGTYHLRVRLETLPPGRLSLKAQLGVRLPKRTRAYELEFFAEGQEERLVFEVSKIVDKSVVSESSKE